MARHEWRHPSKPLGLALGVDPFLTPGEKQPAPKTFIQIWDTSASEQPCDEGKGGFNNILVKKTGLDYHEAHRLAASHGFEVTKEEVCDIFD